MEGPNTKLARIWEAEWDAEVGRRMEAVKAGTAQARSFDEVFAELDRRFPR